MESLWEVRGDCCNTAILYLVSSKNAIASSHHAGSTCFYLVFCIPWRR